MDQENSYFHVKSFFTKFNGTTSAHRRHSLSRCFPVPMHFYSINGTFAMKRFCKTYEVGEENIKCAEKDLFAEKGLL